ncbi:MAG: hypothetical protein PHY54_17675 [Methylococcales bacterium]|nr:hypothetical protein [Methylococcales bacterium]
MQERTEQNDRRLTPFTVNLTPEFVTKALQNKKGFIDYTKRQIDKAMLSELSTIPQYWFVVEIVPQFGGHTKGRQRPHLHGGIITKPSDLESVRKQKTPISKAFDNAVGKCHPDFSERLVDLGNHKAYSQQKGITEATAVINWARYCFKLNTISRLFLNSKTNLTADNETKRQAEALYSLLTQKAPKPSPIDETVLEAFMNWNGGTFEIYPSEV